MKPKEKTKSKDKQRKQRILSKKTLTMGHPKKIKSKDFFHIGNACVWMLFIVVVAVVAVWIVSAFLARTTTTVVVVDDDDDSRDADESFVFRRRSRSECRVGEVHQDSLCIPKFNTPQPYEPSITNISVPLCQSFYNNMCGKTTKGVARTEYASKLIFQKVLETALESSGSAFYTSCKNAGAAGRAKEYEIETKHMLEIIVGDLNGAADIPILFDNLQKHGYYSPFTTEWVDNPQDGSPLFQIASHNTFANVTKALITSIHDANRIVTNYDIIRMADRVRRAYKVIEAINEHNLDSLEDIVDMDAYVTSGSFQGDLLKSDQLPIWYTPYSNPNGWTEFLTTKTRTTDISSSSTADASSSTAHASSSKDSVSSSTKNSVSSSTTDASSINTVWLSCRYTYMQWLLQDAVPHMEINDWRAFAEFSILFGAQRRKMRTTQCAQLTMEMLPGLTTQLLVDANSVAVQRVTAVAQSLLPKNNEAIISKAIGGEIIISKPLETFAARITADRFDHNMNLAHMNRITKPDRLVSYDKFHNTLTLHASVLFSPYYQQDYDDLSLYAGLGTVIAKEIYSKTATSSAAGTTAGSAAGSAAGTTIGTISLSAVRNAAMGVVNSLSSMQHFFMVYAQFWCGVADVNIDEILAATPSFSEAFSCKKN